MATKIIKIKKIPDGVPKIDEDFVIETLYLPPLKTNEILIEAEWISVDPYLRSRLAEYGVDAPMQSFQIAKIVESKDPQHAVGDYVYGHFNWQKRAIIIAEQVFGIIKASEYDPRLSLSHYVGSYGMPGETAWYGIFEVGKLKHGENVLVSGAAGAVGSYVGQIAKLYDCYVVGIAGSQSKIDWIVNDLGFDAGINYKEYNGDSEKLKSKLLSLFPDGIDVYFDNVGGFITESVWDVLADRARVLVCGQIAIYNEKDLNLGFAGNNFGTSQLKVPYMLHKLIYREISVLGFIVSNFTDKTQFRRTMKKWIIEGKIKARETVVHGFDQLPKAFVGLFKGTNTGKMVVRAKL